MGVRLVVPVTLPLAFLAAEIFLQCLNLNHTFMLPQSLHQLLCTSHSSDIDMQELCLGQTLLCYLLELYSSDSQSRNFLCFSESQWSPKKSVVSYWVLYHLPEVRTMTQTIIAQSTEYIMILIVTKIFIITRWSQRVPSLLVVLGRNSVRERCTCDPCLPRSNPLPPYCISNKFPHHHCHVDAAEEGNMLNLQSMPKITPCLDCFTEKGHCVSMGSTTVPGSLSWFLKWPTLSKYMFSRDHAFIICLDFRQKGCNEICTIII